MTETPKCPYCGAEMSAIAIRVAENRYVGWSKCKKCLSEGPGRNRGRTEEEAKEAALGHCESKNRPLTLEEIEKYFDKELDAEPLWIEFHYDALSSRWLPSVPNPNVFGEFTIEYFVRKYGHRYGEYFRCWPRKPTPEQMAAEKWEE